MELWKKSASPARRVCFALSSRVKAPKKGEGLLKLRNEVQTCEYQDVQVMWDMLRGTGASDPAPNPPPVTPPKKKNKGFWKVFVRSHNSRTESPPLKRGA